MNKFGTKNFGFRTSVLLKTNINRTIVTFTDEVVPAINNDFDKRILIRVQFLAKYSISLISLIRLNDSFRLRPTFIFSLSTSDDNNFQFMNTQLFDHESS